MRTILAAVFAVSLGCASTMSSRAGTSPSAQAASCQQVTVDRGTVVYSRPDDTSNPVKTLTDSTKVCADSASVGFGFRHVTLSDGTEGYVADNALNG